MMVRPFVSYRMIVDNIEAMKNYDVADTVVMANDTIVESIDGKHLLFQNRTHMYQGQTPQTFKIQAFTDLYDSLNRGCQRNLDGCM